MNSRFFVALVVGIVISAATPSEIFAQGPGSRGPARRAMKYLGVGWGSGNHWQDPPVNPHYYNPYSQHNTHLVSRSPEYLARFGDDSLTTLDGGYQIQSPGYIGGSGYGSTYGDGPVYGSESILEPLTTPAEPLPFDELPGEMITPEIEELPPPSSVIEDGTSQYRSGPATTQATLEWWER
ncbi:MAG: hypothetical protein AAF456_14440 [Planctomycetota bacterium]